MFPARLIFCLLETPDAKVKENKNMCTYINKSQLSNTEEVSD